MIWLWLATIGSVSMIVVICLLILRTATRLFQHQLEQDRVDHQQQRHQWEVERERLLNRAMTKNWESYTQMNAALQTVDSASEQVAGLSDEREAQLWAMANGEGPGLGEAFATLEDAQELGL